MTPQDAPLAAAATAHSPYRLDGQVALITGSSRGIGRSIAEEMARLGARVVISSRKAEPCEEVAAAIRAAGGDATAIPGNVTHKHELERLVGETRARYGRIDILVPNAAVNPHYGPIETVTDEAYDKIMGVNVRSMVWLCNMVMPEMAERGKGTIIIISSIGGLKAGGHIPVYNMAKAANNHLTMTLAASWGPKGIRVNAIAPGLIKTDFARALWENPAVAARYEKGTPARRLGDPADIGRVAAFLASDAASYIMGQVIVVDGGATIGSVE